MKARNRWRLSVLAGLALLATVGAPVVLQARAQETVEFEVWTRYTPGNEAGRHNAFENVVALWNERHPDIQVEHVFFDPGEFKTTVPLAVESENAGCLITADIGSANLLPWYRAGSIDPLDQYAVQYGWLDKDPGGAFASANLGTRPSTVYDGSEIAGLPFTYQPLGIFYNKQTFAENGLTPPADWDAFIALLDGFTAEEVTPLAFGNAAQFHGLHYLSSLIAANVSVDRLGAWWTGADPNVKFTDPDFLWAAQTARQWAEAGYLTDEFNAVNFDDAVGSFLAGENPMILTGDWNVARFVADSSFEVGYFPFPRHDPAIPWAVVKTPDWPFVLTSWCEHKDEAAQFLDFITTPEVMDLFYEEGQVQPVFPFDPDNVTGSPLQSEVAAGIGDKLTGHYIDVVDTEVHSLAWPANQLLFEGSLSPEDFAAQIQEAHETALASIAE